MRDEKGVAGELYDTKGSETRYSNTGKFRWGPKIEQKVSKEMRSICKSISSAQGDRSIRGFEGSKSFITTGGTEHNGA